MEGGLNPIGWEHSWDRYFLCLFWSIQSITSIGYGNIVPVTFVEVRVVGVCASLFNDVKCIVLILYSLLSHATTTL